MPSPAGVAGARGRLLAASPGRATPVRAVAPPARLDRPGATGPGRGVADPRRRAGSRQNHGSSGSVRRYGVRATGSGSTIRPFRHGSRAPGRSPPEGRGQRSAPGLGAVRPSARSAPGPLPRPGGWPRRGGSPPSGHRPAVAVVSPARWRPRRGAGLPVGASPGRRQGERAQVATSPVHPRAAASPAAASPAAASAGQPVAEAVGPVAAEGRGPAGAGLSRGRGEG